jgi:hypothetical protein
MINTDNQSAIIDRIIQEHSALRDKLHHLHTVLAQPEPTAEEIDQLLREFLNALVLHFTNEEDGGFIDEVTANVPRLVNTAGQLRVEHKELLRETTELCRFAAAGSPSMPWWRELNTRCHVLSKKLMRHERDEHRLMHQFVEDGAGMHTRH